MLSIRNGVAILRRIIEKASVCFGVDLLKNYEFYINHRARTMDYFRPTRRIFLNPTYNGIFFTRSSNE